MTPIKSNLRSYILHLFNPLKRLLALVFGFFEQRMDIYPDFNVQNPPRIFHTGQSVPQFIMACCVGKKKWILLMTATTALIAIFEAFLFSILGDLVNYLSDFLAKTQPQSMMQGNNMPHQALSFSAFWREYQYIMIAVLLLLIISPFIVAIQTMIKHQTLAGAFPMRLRWQFHQYLLHQSLNFFHKEFAGRIVAKLMQTALAVRDIVFTTTDILVYVSVYFISMIVIVGQISLTLAIPFVAWLILYGLAVYYFIPRLAYASQIQAHARSTMTGRVTDAYSNITTVKLFAHTNQEALYTKSAMQEFMGTVNQQMRLVSLFEIVNHTLCVLLITSVSSLGIYLWLAQDVTIGAIAAAGAMSLRLNGLSHWVMWEIAGLFEHIGTVRDGLNMLSQPILIKDQKNAKDIVIQANQARIEFKDISFSYHSASKNQINIDVEKNSTSLGIDNSHLIFKDFNLVIQAGEKIGLVGRSGAGKSTLVNLLLRLYEPQQGHILIGGHNIQDLSQESLRRHISMVTQDTSLLHRSIRENLCYGQENVSEEAMVHAAKQAKAVEFIETLFDGTSKGYDASVGDRGVQLSGGQRQRIAIARVLLKNAPILLLDEATSALDSEIEAAIQENIYQLMQGKTVIAIAHRLSTIAAMDRLIVIDQGSIIETGTHDQLLAKGGLYADLWHRQVAGFLAEK
jgi:ATP-binding cassette, subfamily B, multidrug efflux pump